MWKALIRSAALLACLTLAACASGPSTPSGEKSANVKADPQAQAEFSQALQALKSGRDDDALLTLTGMTRKYPSLAGPFTNLGLLYIRKGKFAEAKQALLQATTIKPDDAVAYNQLGVAYRATASSGLMVWRTGRWGNSNRHNKPTSRRLSSNPTMPTRT